MWISALRRTYCRADDQIGALAVGHGVFRRVCERILRAVRLELGGCGEYLVSGFYGTIVFVLVDLCDHP